MEETTLRRLQAFTADWSRTKRAYVSLDGLIAELAAWQGLAGVRHVHRMLEVGCGSGLFLLAAVASGFADEAVGVDPTVSTDGTSLAEMVRSRRLVEDLGLDERITLRTLSFEQSLREPHRPYDLIVFRQSLHHIYQRSRRRQEDRSATKRCVADLHAARVILRAGATAYVLELSRPSWLFGALHNLYRKRRGCDPIDWSTKRDAQEWADILMTSGYQSIKAEAMPFPAFASMPGMARLVRPLSPLYLISAVAR